MAYGCKVSTGSDIDELRKRGIKVYATNRYTWTTKAGQVALGGKKRPAMKYRRLKDLVLPEVTAVIDPNAPLDLKKKKDPAVQDYLRQSEGVKNGTK